MTGVAHLLDVTITSALALKPSTVYILRVENTKSSAKWHLRKCFSEFCELREKVVTLIDGTTCSSNLSPNSTTSSPSTLTSTSTSTSSCYDSHTSSSSFGSDSSSHLSDHHHKHKHTSTANSPSDRFPYLYKQFPRRQLFGSRSKKVIEQRTHALSLFLHQLLHYMREIKQQNQIAVYFSMMTFLESFFECAAHNENNHTYNSNFNSNFIFNSFSFRSPSTLAKTQAAAAAAAAKMATMPAGVQQHSHRHHHYRPQVPASTAFAFAADEYSDDSGSSDRDSTENEAAVVGQVPPANNFNFARRFYQEYGKNVVAADEDDDDDEEMQLVLSLKQTPSSVAHREHRETKMHGSGSQYASMQVAEAAATPASAIPGGRARADAWAARIEIAGITSAAAARSSGTLSASPSRTQVHNTSKLATSANRVVHCHLQRKQKHTSKAAPGDEDEEILRKEHSRQHQYHNYSQHEQIQPASIVYATHEPQSKTFMMKQKSRETASHHHHHHHHHSQSHAARRMAVEERPEWA